jgi:hypothetical protein
MQDGGPGATKACAACGRTMTWRPRWARNWPAVKYCSGRCRRNPPGPADAAAEQAIRDLLAGRARGASICPGEAARLLAARSGSVDWREAMPAVRAAANRLVAAGEIVMTQGSRVVDPSVARGAIRLRRISA